MEEHDLLRIFGYILNSSTVLELCQRLLKAS